MKLLISFICLLLIIHSNVCTETSVQLAFAKFKVDYNKTYLDKIEEAYRNGIFAASFAAISKHNKEYELGEHTWTMGVNQFADLTHEEFEEMTMLKFSNLPKVNRKYKMKADAIEKSVDWRDTGCITAVKNSGMCAGGCWAFASVASAEFACCSAGVTSNQLSVQQVIDCDDMNFGCSGGYLDKAWEYMIAEGGLQASSDYPFIGEQSECLSDPSEYQCIVKEYEYGAYNGDEEELKRKLNDQPVAVGVDTSNFQFYSGGIFDCKNFNNAGHAVLAVGYVEGSHYILKNQWGTDWGEEGYIRVGGIDNPCRVADIQGYASV